MIVFDVSALVGAAIRRDSVPERALRHAVRVDRVAMSDAIIAELLDVLGRPRLARFLNPELRSEVLAQIYTLSVFFAPMIPVTDCRDVKDNKYLELALAAHAGTIVSNDADLLVLHPWRRACIIRPAESLALLGSATSSTTPGPSIPLQ